MVDAQAFGEGTEASNLEPVVESVRETFEALDGQLSIFEEAVLTADSGFHTEESVENLLDKKIDAYVPDRKFRLRDPQYANLQEHKKTTTDSKHTSTERKYFGAEEFRFDAAGTLICPAGQADEILMSELERSDKGYTGKTFRGIEAACRVCDVRKKCLRTPATKVRQVTKIDKGKRNNSVSSTQRMIERFDTQRGRYFYSRRMGTVEPVFANIVHTLGMNRFTLRGKPRSTRSGNYIVWYITSERSPGMGANREPEAIPQTHASRLGRSDASPCSVRRKDPEETLFSNPHRSCETSLFQIPTYKTGFFYRLNDELSCAAHVISLTKERSTPSIFRSRRQWPSDSSNDMLCVFMLPVVLSRNPERSYQ